MEKNMKWSTSYTYDANGRLIVSEVQGEGSEHYDYDASGNLLSRGEGKLLVPQQEQASPAIIQQAPPPPYTEQEAPLPTAIAQPIPVPAHAPQSPVEAEGGGSWVCPACGRVNTGKFCRVDGTPKPEAITGLPPVAVGNKCPACGNAVSEGAKFCRRCGTKM